MNKLQTKIKKMKNKKGFTLIELIVVIVILGILAAIAIPRLSGFSNKAKIKADIATAKTLATATATLYAEDGSSAAGTFDATGDSAELDGLLPNGMSWTCQMGGTFTVTLAADGSITVTNGVAANIMYPSHAGIYAD